MRATSVTLLLVLILFSCGQVKKEVATEQLIGEYSGTVTYLFKHSLQNIGIDDESTEQKGTVSIYKSESGDTFVRTGEGNLKLAGISLASNGTTFNIPYQNVVNSDKETIKIQGFQTAELEGVKYDGIYYSDENSLIFGYETVIKYDYWGGPADVSVMCVYEFSKMN